MKDSGTKYEMEQEASIGFVHDTIKYSYLVMAIREEFIKNKGNSEILSCRSLVNDVELIKFIANVLGGRG